MDLTNKSTKVVVSGRLPPELGLDEEGISVGDEFDFKKTKTSTPGNISFEVFNVITGDIIKSGIPSAQEAEDLAEQLEMAWDYKAPAPVALKPATSEDEQKKVRKQHEAPYQDMTLEQAKQYLVDRGFTDLTGTRDHGMNSTLYVYTNKFTGQRANLSHAYRDKKGRDLDQAKIAYHLVKQAPRRTQEQKARDNFVLYD